MKTRTILLIMLALLLVFFTSCNSPTSTNSNEVVSSNETESTKSAEDPTSIVIASGPIGGPWYSVVTKMSEILMREIPGLNVSVIEGGAESNLDLLEVGTNAQLGMTSSVALQQSKDGTASRQIEHVTGFLPVVTSYIQAAVPESSEISGFQDILGSRISAGKEGFASELIFREIIESYGITYDDIKADGGKIDMLNWAEYPDMIGDGHLDLVCLNGEIPHNIYMQIEVNTPLRLLSVDKEHEQKVLEKMPSLFTKEFDPGVYKGTKEKTTLFAYAGILAASDQLSDDFVLKVLDILQENKEEIVSELQFVDLLGWENSTKGLSELVTRPSVWSKLNK